MENTFTDRASAPGGARKERPWPWAAAAAFFLLVFFILAFDTTKKTSATFDEIVRIPAAVTYAGTGEMKLDPVGTMPLIRNLLRPALAGMELKTEYGRSWREGGTWRYGWEFMAANRGVYAGLVERARLPVALCGLALALLVFAWGKRLYGWAGGTIALGALCLDPNVIAHSAVAGVDIPTALMCAACWFFWYQWYEKGRLWSAAAAGAFLGFALLGKVLAVAMLPAMAAAAVLKFIAASRGRGKLRLAASCAAALLLAWAAALAVFNSEYGWKEFGRPIGEFNFQSAPLRGAARLLPDKTPLPFPAAFLRDLDASIGASVAAGAGKNDPGRFYFYLDGKTSLEGWSRYFLFAWAYKEPVGAMALLFLGLGAAAAGRRPRRELVILLPAVSFLLVLSFYMKMDTGFRHALPALPFAAVLAGGAAEFRRARPVLVLLLLWMLVAAAHIHPNHLAYFNEPAGGPRNGHAHLLDSNLDWGQNLPALARYMKENNIPRVLLAHFGYVDPAIYGVSYYAAPCRTEPGVYAISPQFYYNIFPQYRGCFEDLRSRPPDDVVAYTYYIYRVTPEELLEQMQK